MSRQVSSPGLTVRLVLCFEGAPTFALGVRESVRFLRFVCGILSVSLSIVFLFIFVQTSIRTNETSCEPRICAKALAGRIRIADGENDRVER